MYKINLLDRQVSGVRPSFSRIKIKLRSFKSSEHIFEKGDGPYRGFGYSSLVSDPLDLATWSQRELQYFFIFSRLVDTKTSIIKMGHIY